MNQAAAAKRSTLDTIRISAFSGNGPAGEWEIRKSTVTLGRVSTNDICLNDKKVSRNHATIEAKPEGLFLRDLGSSNGCWVNGQKISETFIKPLDVVVIAGFRLQISLERGVAPWDDKTAGESTNDRTPAEDSNVIPMRGPKPVMPAAPSAEKSVRTEVVDAPKMEAAAKAAAPAPAVARPASRPAVMYVGGKRVVSKPAPMQKTNPATAPKTQKVITPKVKGEKKPMSKGMKIALILGGLFMAGGLFVTTAGGGAAYYYLVYKPAHHRAPVHTTFTPSSTRNF